MNTKLTIKDQPRAIRFRDLLVGEMFTTKEGGVFIRSSEQGDTSPKATTIVSSDIRSPTRPGSFNWWGDETMVYRLKDVEIIGTREV